MRTVLILSLLLACSPKPDGADEATASTSSSSSATGPTTTGPTTTDSPTTDAPTTDSPTTDPTGAACIDPAETEFGPAVALTIRNDGAVPLFIPTQSFCADVLPVTLFAGDAEIQISRTLCDFSCGEALTGACGCPAGCGDPSDVVQISPGGVYTDTWSGVRVVPFELDAGCAADGCSAMCTAELQTPPGSYTLRATATSAVNNCEPPCTCTANADGWCIFEADPNGAEIVVEAVLDYPTQTAAMLTFN